MIKKINLFFCVILLSTLIVGCGSNSLTGKYHCVNAFVTDDVFEHENRTETIESLDVDLDSLPEIKITGSGENIKLEVSNGDDSHMEQIVIGDEDNDSILFYLSETSPSQLAFLYFKDSGELNMLIPVSFNFDAVGVYEGFEGQTVMCMTYKK